MTHHGARTIAATVLLLALARAAGACGVVVELQTPDGRMVELQRGSTTLVDPWSLTTLVLTLPITECFNIQLSVSVDGRPWDNRVAQTLQPMSPLTFSADETAFALIAPAMFRVTDTQTHTITVVYRDETTESPTTLTYLFQARS